MILSEMKLTQRKAFAVLDNFSAAGIAAIDTMINLVKNRLTEINSQERSNLLKKINEPGKYIKLEYIQNQLFKTMPSCHWSLSLLENK